MARYCRFLRLAGFAPGIAAEKASTCVSPQS
jgi:hypothetical protein